MKLVFNEDILIYQNTDQPKNTFVLLTDIDNGLLKMIDFECRIICLKEIDWDSDFTPWEYGQFKGNGKKTIEKLFSIINEPVYVVGYSLGGLMALYASSFEKNIKGIASVSGSLWYPNLIEYLNSNQICNLKMYFSLGDKESKCKNQLMKTVEDKTKEVVDLLKENNNVFFEYNEGNHFFEANQRLIKGMKYLLK